VPYGRLSESVGTVGEEADAEALRQILAATGGRAFVVKDHVAALEVMTLAFTGRLQ
jgi:hypothetical protein